MVTAGIAETISSAATVIATLAGLITPTRGPQRRILLELRKNIAVLKECLGGNLNADDAIESLESGAYESIVGTRFNFGKIKSGTVGERIAGDSPAMQRYIGWSTVQLLESIYVRMHILKKLAQAPHGAHGVRKRARIANLLRMMLVLSRHIAARRNRR